MLLTITSTHTPASALGYLLHKNPTRLHTEELSFGNAHVFYPEADEARCTVAILLEIDPIALVQPELKPRDLVNHDDRMLSDKYRIRRLPAADNLYAIRGSS